jgi:hypothetical protein
MDPKFILDSRKEILACNISKDWDTNPLSLRPDPRELVVTEEARHFTIFIFESSIAVPFPADSEFVSAVAMVDMTSSYAVQWLSIASSSVDCIRMENLH